MDAGSGFSAFGDYRHSNGGMLAVPHVVAHADTPALVLLSAHGGGRDGLRRTSQSGLMAGERLEELTAQAHAMVAAGRGRELMLMPGWWYVISAESFLDRNSQMPDTLELAPQVTCPVLYLRGDQENPANYPAEAFQARAGGPCEVDIIPDCDHFYRGQEDAVIARVTAWLRKTLPLR
jgi:pimeloyl-ACP methyl ester carboxylesterase